MAKIIYLSLITLSVFLLSCGGGNSSSSSRQIELRADPNAPRRFIPALPPAMLTADEHQAYMIDHYWDRFDFADTLFIAEIDTAQMLSAYAHYVAEYVPDSLAERALSRLMAKASSSSRMFDYFMMLSQTVLHDPNSPLRSDEKYIPVLEAALASPFYNEYERLPYQSDLEMARQNRIGRVANDFGYTLLSGRRATMHEIESDYLLIFISNLGCPMCRNVREQIEASPMLNELIERGDLKVLVVYPDADLDTWRQSAEEYPPTWINGYDADQLITRQRLYDLKAIPALYLLDGEKRVMVKDCVDVEQIEYCIYESETN